MTNYTPFLHQAQKAMHVLEPFIVGGTKKARCSCKRWQRPATEYAPLAWVQHAKSELKKAALREELATQST